MEQNKHGYRGAVYQIDDLTERQVKGHVDGPATVRLLPGVVWRKQVGV